MRTAHDMAAQAMAQMPQQFRFTATDAQVLARYRSVLLSLESAFVKGFYDIAFGHPATAAVFQEGERPMREQTLAEWWRRTVGADVDDDYFAWMAMVGLAHVLREVTNPMMLAMTDHIWRFAFEHLDTILGLPPRDPDQVQATDLATEMRMLEVLFAFSRLGTTVGAVIAHGYGEATSSALYEVAGMPDALVKRLRDREVTAALRADRARLRR
ncbi:MAG: protoglobin domain-containing protein [Kineosporiaceae bacterium]